MLVCHKLKVFENKMLRIVLRPKVVEVAEGWRKLHNLEFYHLYSPPSTVRLIISKM